MMALFFSMCLQLFMSCSPQEGSTSNSDSSLVEKDTLITTAQTQSQSTILGETIQLQHGENYSIGQYLSYNASSNILLFESSNGNALELVSPPWSRTGALQLSPQYEIRPKLGGKYELIYRKVLSQQDPTDTQFLLIDLISAGGIFHEAIRYNAYEEGSFTTPTAAKGVFVNDVEDEELECKNATGLPELYYKSTKATSISRLNLTVINSRILKAEIENGVSFFLRFHDNNWEQIDLVGSRRVYRKLVR
jgi:hypothetical protein